MEFEYNRDKKSLINVMKSKAEKKNLKVDLENDKISITLEQGKFNNGEDAIPVTFKGKLADKSDKCIISGKFTYGFYLYGLVFFAAILIVARFVASAMQKQTDNIILCLVVTVLLAIVIVVVNFKSKKGKAVIEEYLKNLNVR